MSTDAAAAGAPGAATTEEAAPDLLDQILTATRPQSDRERESAKEYFQQFLQQAVAAGPVVAKDAEAAMKYWIGELDKKLTAQVNEIMHHETFQKLEGTWRGLHYLVMNSETGETLKIRVLNITKKELARDLEKAVEFDQSTLFKRIYEEEYGQLGGQPYGMLVGDYEFGRGPEDVQMLKSLAGVAAASHAPFVAAAGAKMFGMDRFTELSNPRDMAKIFEGADYAPWRSFRESEDSRYVALTMPRVLSRLPYGPDGKSVEGFNFTEAVDGTNHDKYSWMSSAWAYAARVTDSYAQYGWFAKTRGVEAGGKVENLPVHTFPTDEGDVAMKCPTEVAISDRREYELSNLGFLPLIHYKNRDCAAFIGAQSCQKPKQFFDPEATANAELSSKFNLILNTSRFAHYLKVMARDKIGAFMELGDVNRWLNSWILNYVVANPQDVGEATRAKKPLQAASVEVREVKGRPGSYEAVAYLRPHFQLESLSTSLRMVATIPTK